ncbi:MAG: hypothetical protein AAFQ43_09615 [Bacteroidota bacterium]
MRVAILVGLGLFISLAPGAKEGRLGNADLAETPAEAETHYIAGLAEAEAPPEIRAALWHNLGLARFAGGRSAEADSAFANGLEWAADAEQRARLAYGAGTAALDAGDLPGAIASLRRSLVLDPTHAPSRVNLEIALLRQRRDDQDEPPAPPEPSPFAERLKAQADSLVDLRQYPGAFDLMQEGLARDSTVAAFGEYIQRLGDIVRIDTTGTP